MRTALAFYVFPLGLLSLYVLLSLGVSIFSARGPAHCVLLGINVTRLPGIDGPDAVLAPVILAWLGFGGIAYWAAWRWRARG
ncbi:hypothetical protein SAMN05444722_1653 [Rhodovulum sp. ES.010]|uniref:hypothetical protein n=1 Tax=Rhodovulum sp. ES.010 TaxID=1882821 RepID=UPI0009261B15|nr:hypothetical protein [Rhodovulum sp. ES.010]SIO35904.1 hypothetical protein SAMN05444722_1653 [Rhodovulum sp. ES.010]